MAQVNEAAGLNCPGWTIKNTWTFILPYFIINVAGNNQIRGKRGKHVSGRKICAASQID